MIIRRFAKAGALLLAIGMSLPSVMAASDSVWASIVDFLNLNFLGGEGGDAAYYVAFTRMAVFFLLFTVIFAVLKMLKYGKDEKHPFAEKNVSIVIAFCFAGISAVFIPGSLLLVIGMMYASVTVWILVGAIIFGLFFLYWALHKSKDGKPVSNAIRTLSIGILAIILAMIFFIKPHITAFMLSMQGSGITEGAASVYSGLMTFIQIAAGILIFLDIIGFAGTGPQHYFGEKKDKSPDNYSKPETPYNADNRWIHDIDRDALGRDARDRANQAQTLHDENQFERTLHQDAERLHNESKQAVENLHDAVNLRDEASQARNLIAKVVPNAAVPPETTQQLLLLPAKAASLEGKMSVLAKAEQMKSQQDTIGDKILLEDLAKLEYENKIQIADATARISEFGALLSAGKGTHEQREGLKHSQDLFKRKLDDLLNARKIIDEMKRTVSGTEKKNVKKAKANEKDFDLYNGAITGQIRELNNYLHSIGFGTRAFAISKEQRDVVSKHLATVIHHCNEYAQELNRYEESVHTRQTILWHLSRLSSKLKKYSTFTREVESAASHIVEANEKLAQYAAQHGLRK
jgi:hypothetical protein